MLKRVVKKNDVGMNTKYGALSRCDATNMVTASATKLPGGLFPAIRARKKNFERVSFRSISFIYVLSEVEWYGHWFRLLFSLSK